ncbi:uncharacterized protein LOC135827028 [Sycon ciliatum]|uniref:uncharacterized protein LOC135827028 n=1 Tax=Sycon ciliatum TaxID=27933 RepID=UPI0031F6CA7A
MGCVSRRPYRPTPRGSQGLPQARQLYQHHPQQQQQQQQQQQHEDEGSGGVIPGKPSKTRMAMSHTKSASGDQFLAWKASVTHTNSIDEVTRYQSYLKEESIRRGNRSRSSSLGRMHSVTSSIGDGKGFVPRTTSAVSSVSAYTVHAVTPRAITSMSSIGAARGPRRNSDSSACSDDRFESSMARKCFSTTHASSSSAKTGTRPQAVERSMTVTTTGTDVDESGFEDWTGCTQEDESQQDVTVDTSWNKRDSRQRTGRQRQQSESCLSEVDEMDLQSVCVPHAEADQAYCRSAGTPGSPDQSQPPVCQSTPECRSVLAQPQNSLSEDLLLSDSISANNTLNLSSLDADISTSIVEISREEVPAIAVETGSAKASPMTTRKCRPTAAVAPLICGGRSCSSADPLLLPDAVITGPDGYHDDGKSFVSTGGAEPQQNQLFLQGQPKRLGYSATTHVEQKNRRVRDDAVDKSGNSLSPRPHQADHKTKSLPLYQEFSDSDSFLVGDAYYFCSSKPSMTDCSSIDSR